jgi:hypothetical protein
MGLQRGEVQREENAERKETSPGVSGVVCGVSWLVRWSSC